MCTTTVAHHCASRMCVCVCVCVFVCVSFHIVLHHYEYITTYAYAYGMNNSYEINQHVCIHACERVPVLSVFSGRPCARCIASMYVYMYMSNTVAYTQRTRYLSAHRSLDFTDTHIKQCVSLIYACFIIHVHISFCTISYTYTYMYIISYTYTYMYIT